MIRPLKDGEKRALARLDAGTWKRKLGGWDQPGVPSIALDTGNTLIAMGLARKDGDWLKITASGRVLLDKLTSKQRVET